MLLNENETHHFKVDFKPEIVYTTLWDLVKQFNDNCITKVEIEIFAWTIRQQKVSWNFKHDVGAIMPCEFGNGNVQLKNLFAVAYEHGNKEMNFAIWFQKPYELADNVIVLPGQKSD